MFDVIEHLPDPGILLKEVYRILKTGGKVFISVPAFPILWSDFDVFSGHCRRYSVQSLIREISPFFSVHSVRYFFSSLWIPTFLLRSIPYRLRILGTKDREAKPNHTLSPVSGFLIEKLLSLESRFEHPRLPGTSIFLVASKSHNYPEV
jgi:SAM-dependent methyltransferase